jgi:hypothetical protein
VFVVSWIPDSIPRRFAPLHASGKRAEVLALGPPPFSRRVKRAQRSNPVRDPELGLAFRESRSPEGQDPRDPDAAWETARRIALDAMSVDEGRPASWRACHGEVKGADGEIVLEFPFKEAVADEDGLSN